MKFSNFVIFKVDKVRMMYVNSNRNYMLCVLSPLSSAFSLLCNLLETSKINCCNFGFQLSHIFSR